MKTPMQCPTLRCGGNRWRLLRDTRDDAKAVGLIAVCLRCMTEFRIGIAPKEIPWPSPSVASA